MADWMNGAHVHFKAAFWNSRKSLGHRSGPLKFYRNSSVLMSTIWPHLKDQFGVIIFQKASSIILSQNSFSFYASVQPETQRT